MQTPFRSHRRVEFRDTDAAGIMHFSTFFTCMEEVEHEFLRAMGTSVMMPLEARQGAGKNAATTGTTIGWPRVAAECQYRGSARFEEQLQIELRIAELGKSSVTYRFQFRVEGREIATGSLTSVCCKIQPDRPPESMPIPEPLRKRLAGLVEP